MKTLSIGSSEFLEGTRKPSGLDSLARRVVRSRLAEMRHGRLVLCENGREEVFGDVSEDCPLTARLIVNDPRCYSEVAFGGSIGAGEAYIHGYWSTDNLTNVVRIFVRNREVLANMDSGAALVTRPFQKLFHWLHRNTQKGSRRNIAAHYDLGNEFYRLWLDRRMMYSSAFFECPDMSLDAASTAKLDRICRKLDLGPDDHVIEIGTGWGGFAIYAAAQYGCRVTTTTISRQQYEYARGEIERAGLTGRITLLLKDYRELEGEFDKLVSIEMIEAVGYQYHDTFFRKCADLLTPRGEMLLQSITIADQYYEQAIKGVDFIKRYIFPGGCLTSVTAMAASLTRVTDMRVTHLEDIGPHYATTLKRWHDRFFASIDKVGKLGFSDEFVRMWQYYLCYCEGGFIERTIGNVQMHVIKPDARPPVFSS